MNSEQETAYWNRHAKSYDRSMALLGRPLPRMLELVAAAIRGRARVLEVAAGTGLVTPVLAREAREVIATDYASKMVDELEARVEAAGVTNVRCEQADLYSLRFEQGSFDAVVAANMLHLVPDLAGALASLKRVLRSGGRLVVPTFCHDETAVSWLVSRALALTGFPGHRRFTVRSLVESLKQAGVAIELTDTLPGLIPIGYVQGVFEGPGST